MSRIISRYAPFLFLTNMEDENIFEYGPYKLYKDAFLENLAKNMDKYIRDHRLNDPQLLQDFKDAVDFIGKGMGDYITYTNGSGAFKDNRGYLTSKKLGHIYAANYANFVAHKQGALGNATPKKKKEEIEEEEKKPLFDPTKNIIGLEFERAANPLGNDSGYSMWKDGLENPVEQLRQLINTHKEGLSKYDFSGTNLTLDFYEKALNSLYTGLENGVDDEDIEKMSRLGFKNPRAFMPIQEKPTNITSTLSNDRLKLLMDNLKFTVDPTTKTWVDPSGYNTQIPATVDPENPGEEYKNLFAAWLQHTRGNNTENEKVNVEEIDSNYKDFILTFAPTLATLGSVLNPEPISGTIMGLAGDLGNAYNNSQDEDGFTLGDLGELGLNVLGTAAGAIPYIGDWLGNVPKLYKGFRDSWKVTSKLIESLGIAGTIWYGEETWNFIKDSLTNIVNKDKDEITKEDWANALNAITEITQLYRNIKAGKVYSNAKRTSQLKDAITVKGSDKKKHILTGLDAVNIKDLLNLDDVKSLLKDFGFEPIELPRSDKNIYNPDLLKREAGDGRFSRARGWAERQSDNTIMHTRKGNNSENSTETPPNKPTKIKTVEDLRNTVKAKLQADGKSPEVIELVDALLRNVKKDDRGLFTKGWLKIGGAKYSHEFEQAVGILVNNGYSRPQATEMLLGVGLHKHGGILKASGGIKINAKDIDLRTYKGWDEHFNYDETNKMYSLKEGYNSDALTKWGTTNGLNITLPTQNYGSNYEYTPQNSLYKEGASSIGFKHANNANRSENLIKSPDNSDELDLNAHWQSRRMYNTDDPKKNEYNRKRDFILAMASTKTDSRTLLDMLGIYNKVIDRMYAFKQSDKGITYTGSNTSLWDLDVDSYNWNNYNFYRSQNTDLLHGFDTETTGKNGSGTMGRSVDRAHAILTFTEDDFKGFDDSYYDGLKELLLNQTFTNDGTGRYYIGSPELTITKANNSEGVDGNSVNGGNNGGVDGSSLKGDNNSIEIAPTGEPMTKKPNRSLEPLFSAFNYYNSLRTNKKILDLTNELTPLLYDPVEHPRTIHGDLLAIAEGQRQAAEFERLAATPMTSDGSLQLAMLMEAKLKGLESIRAGLKADNDEVRRTTDLAIAQEKEDKNNRHEVAMKNRENMHQVNVTKLQAIAGKTRSDYESTKNFVDEIKKYYAIKHAKDEKILDTIYARSLLQDIYKNPQNYMPGWNTYHDDIWKKGISGKQLTAEELEVFNLLKLLFTNAYYSNLYYNTTPIDTSVKDITAAASDYTWIKELAKQKELKKRGGKLSKDDAKLVLEFLKESNKNYNKAMDRSARSMYNYIKLLRKK